MPGRENVDKIHVSLLNQLLRRRFCGQTLVPGRLVISEVVAKWYEVPEGNICRILGPVSFLQKESAFSGQNPQCPLMGGLFCLF